MIGACKEQRRKYPKRSILESNCARIRLTFQTQAIWQLGKTELGLLPEQLSLMAEETKSVMVLEIEKAWSDKIWHGKTFKVLYDIF